MDLRFDRVKMLFGDDFTRLQEAKVLILGIGGVGGFALDCLYRSGVENITVVDFDSFEESNQNRQIGSEALGESKVEVFKRLYPKIIGIQKRIDKEWIEEFDFGEFDVIIDAIDDTKAKVELAKRVHKKLIMSLGAGKRIEASKIEVSTIWKTHTDALARKIRSELKRAKFNKNFKVVFSTEEPKTKEFGSFVGVTGAFGLFCCSETIKMILGNKRRKIR